jgi:hypothetical protein
MLKTKCRNLKIFTNFFLTSGDWKPWKSFKFQIFIKVLHFLAKFHQLKKAFYHVSIPPNGSQFVRASPTSFPAGPLEKLKSKFICNHVAICIIYWFIHSIRSCFVSCIVSFNQSHHHGFISCKLVTFHILVGSKMPDLEHACMVICGKCQGIKTSHNITKRVCFWRKSLQTQVPAIIIWIAMSYWTNISLLTSSVGH